jgi:hypothetical protein
LKLPNHIISPIYFTRIIFFQPKLKTFKDKISSSEIFAIKRNAPYRYFSILITILFAFDAGYAVVFSKSTFTNGSYDTYVVKTDSLGHSSDCHEVDVIYPNISVTFSTSPLSASIVSSTGLEVGNFNQSYGIEFYLDPKVNASSSILDVQCFGGSDGSIDVTTFGGKAPYTINWNNVTSSEDISNLTAGEYTLQISDALGCTFKDTLVVNEPQPINIAVSDIDVSCNGGGDGSANASVSGGTEPYVYLWSIGQQDSTAIGLFEGTYIINVVDNNGCMASSSIYLYQPDLPQNKQYLHYKWTIL